MNVNNTGNYGKLTILFGVNFTTNLRFEECRLVTLLVDTGMFRPAGLDINNATGKLSVIGYLQTVQIIP